MNNTQSIKALYEKYHILDKEANEIEKKILEVLDKIINLEEENKQGSNKYKEYRKNLCDLIQQERKLDKAIQDINNKKEKIYKLLES